MIISRILHAGYIFESQGVQIAFDPIFETPFSTNCFPQPTCRIHPPQHLRFDAVFLSHFHDDHCSLKSLDSLDRQTPIFLYCIHDELFEMIRALGFKTVESLVIGEAVTVEGFTVTPRLALDPDIDTFFSIEAEGLHVLNVVDAWIDPREIERLTRVRWDLVLWPFQTMLEIEALTPTLQGEASREIPIEWTEQILELKPRFIVPSSCQFRFEDESWLNARYFPITYREFSRAMIALDLSPVVMPPGSRFELTSDSFRNVGRLPWVEPIGDQDVDYVYDPHTEPTPVSEIAKRYPAPPFKRLERLREFAARFSVRLWFPDGTSFGQGPNEIAAYKLWRALDEGEALTSLHLRCEEIDENEFIRELSKDPLSFQRAQLRRLKGTFYSAD